ncbi:MAG: ABC transporter permease [Chloroflexi bacterium]|nr:ABC transporter permease [Chloroflexota bacterium]MCC6891744.1 ABC transporter permease [Anaerolineae bacterium]
MASATSGTQSPYRLQGRAGALVAEYGLLLILIVLFVLFNALNPRFLTLANMTTLLTQNSAMMIVSVGMTFAIISKHIDLSPASLIALSGTIMGIVFAASGSIILAIAAAFVTAVFVEVFNAILIARVGINPLIVTLASWIWARGLAVSLTGAESISVQHPFIDFMNASLFLQITPPVVLTALAFIAGGFVLNRTRLGRYTFAMGSDERATIQAGVPTTKYKLLMFAMFGLFVGLATLITVSRLGAAAPDAAYGLELDAIVAVIIGGNPFQGGEGKLRRTLIGALFIAVLNNGLSNLGMLDAQIATYKGAAIILALLFGVVSVRLLRRKI